ncbi:MAG: ArnT family glycosyltransferase [Chthoniobacterales bacterium]
MSSAENRRTLNSPADSPLERAAVYFGLTGRAEFIFVAGLFTLMLLLKIVNASRYRFDTDESQHLHVIWGWAHGFVQYRDVCDNHMPLFQLAMTPIFGLLGDRADILYWMRFLMLPLYLLAVWCTYRIGAICFSRRTGVWAAILAGAYPGYHFCSLEFRTDNLWAPLCLLTMLLLLEGRLTARRAAAGGVVLGLCFGVSMKSVLLLISILVGAGLTLAFVRPARLGIAVSTPFRLLAAFLTSSLIVPAIIISAFVLAGVWEPFRYWVFENNVVPGLTNHPAWWILAFPLLMPLVIYGGGRLVRASSDPALAFRRGFLFFTCGFYMPALWSFWPLVTRQDYLPWHPLAFIFYAAAAAALSDRITAARFLPARSHGKFFLPALAAGVELAAVIIVHPFWINGAKGEARLLADTLAVTEPADVVLDEKGETVFRQRAFGPIWEPCVNERIARGQLADTAAEQCVQKRCCVAVLGKDISVNASAFILHNYLPVAKRLRVAGAWLRRSPSDSQRFEFETTIPAAYEVIARAGAVAGLLDGKPLDAPRFLAPGPHMFISAGHEDDLVALWAQAADRDFTPFHHNNIHRKPTASGTHG